jgi:hypothetical protein
MTKKNRSSGELGEFLEINGPQGIALYLSGNGDRLQRLQENKGKQQRPYYVLLLIHCPSIFLLYGAFD